MPEKKIKILDFDGSVTSQTSLVARYHPDIIDLKDLGPRVRFWMDRDGMREVERRIPPSDKETVTFLGSGDFHHVAEILLKRHNEPISVIDFDFHPDWDTIFPMLHCGSWVTHAMKNPNVKKLVMIGASSRDLLPFSLQAGDLSSLKDNRIEIYPYSRNPGIIFFRNIPDNISLSLKRYPLFTKVYWKELKDKNVSEFFKDILTRLPTKKVYITIDKDCMGTKGVLTNWDQGALPLEELLDIIKIIKENFEIVGIDITGDYSPVNIKGIFKNIASWLDHPKDIAAEKLPGPLVNETNEKTNLKILDIIMA